MPAADVLEGTASNPLALPSNLCTASLFTVLCDFLYPVRMGQFPHVSIANIDHWEAVLKATAALQMEDTQQYILQKLQEDAPNIKSNAARILRLALDYDDNSISNLLFGALFVLAYRCQPISPTENVILGEKAITLVNYTRESVRCCFFLGKAKAKIQTNTSCDKENCKTAIFRKIIANMQTRPPPNRVVRDL
ncbi:The BTB (BR-C, ttk and bab)/POZ (Pox virus and Zinc finger) domain [Rhizoctonia solani]|uniref:The BTB (BR-C, ttk and bab)/POZ (Pox virus and Zinc finger) domain n=1 Tax=Rhizoctonia solani TaxID=456999 RepID=A0A8H8SZS5_9AGAM|nr:The BTB (BR-C, ttk and bab)/POZ (Pox virus and Zinc finger) domain [Rhizoctonia solani]QRW23924.1 The BTB (BR-C, ttk and bab)/POZ (Pox virus and Zinc finger) domain [Rhizoctonia solani]